jgi:hypothetical protein
MATNNKQRVTLFLNPGLLTHARAQAVVEGRSLTVLVERALMKYLPKETVIKKAVIRVDPDP